jgi:hypothetical protein
MANDYMSGKLVNIKTPELECVGLIIKTMWPKNIPPYPQESVELPSFLVDVDGSEMVVPIKYCDEIMYSKSASTPSTERDAEGYNKALTFESDGIIVTVRHHINGKKIALNIKEYLSSSWEQFEWIYVRPDIVSNIRHQVVEAGGNAVINVHWIQYDVCRGVMIGDIVLLESE